MLLNQYIKVTFSPYLIVKLVAFKNGETISQKSAVTRAFGVLIYSGHQETLFIIYNLLVIMLKDVTIFNIVNCLIHLLQQDWPATTFFLVIIII